MTEPFPFQIKGVRAVHRMGGRVLLADEQGTGKSYSSLLYMHHHPDIKPALVVCPATMKWAWKEEAGKHFGMASEVLSGTVPPKVDELARPSLTIINYDVLRFWLPLLLRRDYGLLILDECQACSNSSKRTAACRKLARKIPKVLALSGTPMTGMPIQLFNILNMLRPDLWPSRIEFGLRYCGAKRSPWGMTYRGATRVKELNQKLKAHVMVRRLKEEVLKELPPKRRCVLPVDLPDRKEYDQAHKDIRAWLLKHRPERARSALLAEALTKLSYLKQLAGKLKLPLVKEWVNDFLEGGKEKLVVFAVHKEVISSLRERYGAACTVLDGSTLPKDRQRAVERFHKDPKCRLFLGNIQAAGTGITLAPAASTTLICELDWRPALHLQAEDRSSRIGTVSPTTCYYMIARATVEEKLAKIIDSKQNTISRVMDGGPREDDLDVFEQLLREMME